jgi:hypothetical protein
MRNLPFLALLISLSLSFGTTASADVLHLHCYKGETPETCATLAETAIQNLGCVVESEKTGCTYALKEDPNDPRKTVQADTAYCEVTSSNCAQPNVGNFGGETCYDSRKVTIAKKSRIHNGYWFGAFGSYSRTVCIAP